MGMEETAQDVLHLVQALAQGKKLEYRGKGRTIWSEYGPRDGELLFYLAEIEYRIKPDPLEAWRKELLDLLKKYGVECDTMGVQRERNLLGAAEKTRVEALKLFKQIEDRLAFGSKGFQ